MLEFVREAEVKEYEKVMKEMGIRTVADRYSCGECGWSRGHSLGCGTGNEAARKRQEGLRKGKGGKA